MLGKKTSLFDEVFDFTVAQKAEILNLEERLYASKKQLDQMILREIDQRLALVKMKLFIAKAHLDLFKIDARKIRTSIKIPLEEVEFAKAELINKKEESFPIQERYRQEGETLAADSAKKIAEREDRIRQGGIVLSAEHKGWFHEMEGTAADYIDFLQTSLLDEQIMVLERKKELAEIQTTLEHEKFSQDVMMVEIKETFHKIITDKFAQEDEISQEIKKYETPQAECVAKIARIKDKKNSAQELIDKTRTTLEELKKRTTTVQQDTNKFFDSNTQDRTRALELIAEGQKEINVQIELLEKIIVLYGTAQTTIVDTMQQINFIMSELNSITIWHRTEQAITWDRLKESGAELEGFAQEIQLYLKQFTFETFIQKIAAPWRSSAVGSFLFALLMLGIFLGTVQRLSPRLDAWLAIDGHQRDAAKRLPLFFSMIFAFIKRHSLDLALWFGFFITLTYQPTFEPYLHILFYILSIPYLLYMVSAFVRHIANFNAHHVDTLSDYYKNPNHAQAGPFALL